MHTSKILRSQHFRVTDARGAPFSLTDGLTEQDRLGIVSPRYEDGIEGAGGATLAFVTAFYDLQRAREAKSGQPFFIYADYFAFLFGADGHVTGRSQAAPLAAGIGDAYGQLDVWPDDKWVIVRDPTDLWAQIAQRRITHLLLPAASAETLDPIPEMVASQLKAAYCYLLPGQQVGAAAISLALDPEPVQMIAEAVSRLPAESPLHHQTPQRTQRLVVYG